MVLQTRDDIHTEVIYQDEQQEAQKALVVAGLAGKLVVVAYLLRTCLSPGFPWNSYNTHTHTIIRNYHH